jgi:iron-sulfur cluster insertion protein
MVQFTERAAGKIREMAEAQTFLNHGVRVMVVGGGCAGFTYDMDFDEAPREDDEVDQQHGLRVFVDGMSAAYLDGTMVDYVESLDFSGFHFENPSATRTCGCGSSFS